MNIFAIVLFGASSIIVDSSGNLLEFVILRRQTRETQTTARSEAKAQTESRTGSEAIENTRSYTAHSVAVTVDVAVVAAVDDGVLFVTCKESEPVCESERESVSVSWRLSPSAYQYHCALSLVLGVVVFSLSLSVSRSLIAHLVRR